MPILNCKKTHIFTHWSWMVYANFAKDPLWEYVKAIVPAITKNGKI